MRHSSPGLVQALLACAVAGFLFITLVHLGLDLTADTPAAWFGSISLALDFLVHLTGVRLLELTHSHVN